MFFPFWTALFQCKFMLNFSVILCRVSFCFLRWTLLTHILLLLHLFCLIFLEFHVCCFLTQFRHFVWQMLIWFLISFFILYVSLLICQRYISSFMYVWLFVFFDLYCVYVCIFVIYIEFFLIVCLSVTVK